MKKIITLLYIIGLVLLIYLFQLFIVDGRTLFGVKPNLILIFVIVVSLWYGLYSGILYGFVIGFVTDIIFGNNTGMFTITYTLIGMIIGYLHKNYTRDNKRSLVYVTLFSTAIFEILQYIQYIFITGIYSNIFYLIKQIIISSLLNIVIVYIVYGLVYKIVDYFENNLRRNLTGF